MQHRQLKNAKAAVMSQPIQLDASFSFQQAALAETYRALCKTHGVAFAVYFVDECKAQVMSAARTRLCGRSEAGLMQEVNRLKVGCGLA
ncbi:hypothetical protein GTP46_27645 [Duganella sp. FT135W]|uniref:Uncharacterized protein n=1 Tax=Duganella flavida TaxID=2692175 RepID=A0A6L8KJL7_9BURK|nr:hypothetical protein [Duganella flavida]MYM26408.1 hypothetical protein [Duganella flavida]